MTIQDFLNRHQATAAHIHSAESLAGLLEDMKLGLSGRGNIPMLASYLNPCISIPAGAQCCVLDAGGTKRTYKKALPSSAEPFLLQDKFPFFQFFGKKRLVHLGRAAVFPADQRRQNACAFAHAHQRSLHP